MTRVKIHVSEVKVLKEHLDENNHVNNVQYLQWVQDIAKAHWQKEAKPLWLAQYVWVALSHHIEYKKPAFLHDKLQVKTFIQSFDGVKSIRKVEISNVKTGQLLCHCETVWVMLDKKTNRPVRCPQEMVDAFYTLNE
jgi:acyl-CoA thioester hydrolase